MGVVSFSDGVGVVRRVILGVRVVEGNMMGRVFRGVLVRVVGMVSGSRVELSLS